MVGVCNAGASIPQPPPRMPVQYAEQRESDEERQFRKVFQQLAGDVSAASYLSDHGLFPSHDLFHLINEKDPRCFSVSIMLHHIIVCLYHFLMLT